MPKNLYLREGVWWARFMVAGEEYRRSLRTGSERIAEKRLKALKEEIEDQTVYGIAGPITWPAAVTSWRDNTAPSLSPTTRHRYQTSFRQLRGLLDEKMVQEITPAVLKDIIKARRKAGVTNATIRRDLTAMSSVLNHAADEGWIEENPVDDVNRRRVVPERVVRIVLPQPESVSAVFAKLPPRIRDLCEFTRETGLRLDEVTSLRHGAVDRTARLITVVKGKGHKVRTVSLTDAAGEIIDRQPRYIGQPWVFWQGEGQRITGVSSRIGGYMRRLAQKSAQDGTEFHAFSHHDFRHLFAVEYLRNGRGSIYALQGELGHDSITTTERYLAFLTPEQAATARSGVSQNTAHEPRSGTAKMAENG